MSFYVILRGPLGVGKSTVSERLARRIGGRVISIDQLLDDHGLWSEGQLSEFLEANAFAAARARGPLRLGTPVVFDGNFYWEAQIEDLVDRLEDRHLIFTLRAPLPVCIERDGGRPRPHGPDAARAVFAKSTTFAYGIEVDAEGSVDSVLEALVSRLSRDHFL